MANMSVNKKRIDNTHLSIEQAVARGVLHRDHDAHVYRWTHVAKLMHQGSRYKTARILDVGCGRDVPLACLLHSNRLLTEEYVGVDYNAKSKFTDRNWGSMNVSLYGNVIFPRDLKLVDGGYTVKGNDTVHRLPNVITSFEVAEHVQPKHVVSMLKAMYKIAVKAGAEVIISTPCWNWKDTAKNHPNEMSHQALGATIENIGFSVDHNFGTFGNIYDYKDTLFKRYPGIEAFFNDQRAYYDTNILSNMFVTQFPHLARNSLWRLTPAKEDYKRKFPMLSECKTPWTSSAEWEDLKLSEK